MPNVRVDGKGSDFLKETTGNGIMNPDNGREHGANWSSADKCFIYYI